MRAGSTSSLCPTVSPGPSTESLAHDRHTRDISWMKTWQLSLAVLRNSLGSRPTDKKGLWLAKNWYIRRWLGWVTQCWIQGVRWKFRTSAYAVGETRQKEWEAVPPAGGEERRGGEEEGSSVGNSDNTVKYTCWLSVLSLYFLPL